MIRARRANPAPTVVRRVRASKLARSWSLKSTTRRLRGPDISSPSSGDHGIIRPLTCLSSTSEVLPRSGTKLGFVHLEWDSGGERQSVGETIEEGAWDFDDGVG